MRFVSGPTGEKLRPLCIESGTLRAEVSEKAESPEGDRERESACGTVDLTGSLETAGRDSWAEVEDGEERGSDCWVLGIQLCSLSRESVAVQGFAAKSTCIGAEYDVPPSLPDGRVDEEGDIIPTTGTCMAALLSWAGSFTTRPGAGGTRPPPEASSTSIAATSSPEDERSLSLVLLPLVRPVLSVLSLPLRLREI